MCLKKFNLFQSSANIMLANHWGPEREVVIKREPNTSLGISIVGGKMDLQNSGSDVESAILGIFIKKVIPNSPAGMSGDLQVANIILGGFQEGKKYIFIKN